MVIEYSNGSESRGTKFHVNFTEHMQHNTNSSNPLEFHFILRSRRLYYEDGPQYLKKTVSNYCLRRSKDFTFI